MLWFLLPGSIVRVFLTKSMARFVGREEISDASLCEAIGRAERGLIDTALGSGLIKQRMARRGRGKSGGNRTLIGYLRGDRAVFVFGFAKKDREGINTDALAFVRGVATGWLDASDAAIEFAQASGTFQEVFHGGEEFKMDWRDAGNGR